MSSKSYSLFLYLVAQQIGLYELKSKITGPVKQCGFCGVTAAQSVLQCPRIIINELAALSLFLAESSGNPLVIVVSGRRHPARCAAAVRMRQCIRPRRLNRLITHKFGAFYVWTIPHTVHHRAGVYPARRASGRDRPRCVRRSRSRHPHLRLWSGTNQPAD